MESERFRQCRRCGVDQSYDGYQPCEWKQGHWAVCRDCRTEIEAGRAARLRRAGGKLTRSQRRAVWERDAGICYLCGGPADASRFHVDHIRPLIFGGTNDPSNLAVTHPVCNGRKASGEAKAVKRLVATARESFTASPDNATPL